MTKVQDFINREDDLANLKKPATPEDAEYFAYEQELQQSLTESHYIAEKIIGFQCFKMTVLYR